MAATYELDVSITLDDLAWHFLNWYDHDLAQETSRGLHELEAAEPAVLFDEAYRLVAERWEEWSGSASQPPRRPERQVGGSRANRGPPRMCSLPRGMLPNPPMQPTNAGAGSIIYQG